MMFPGAMLVLLVLALMVQEFVPNLALRLGATLEIPVLLPWVVFYTLALTVPFPVMLGFALVLGFSWDARHLIPLEVPDLAFGSSILLFALLGSLVQGIRPLFRKGHWILPIVMVGIAVFFHLVFQYLVLSFQRGQFFISAEIWFKMLLAGGVAMVLAPFLLTLISLVAQRCGYRLEYEKTLFRKPYAYQI